MARLFFDTKMKLYKMTNIDAYKMFKKFQEAHSQTERVHSKDQSEFAASLRLSNLPWMTEAGAHLLKL